MAFGIAYYFIKPKIRILVLAGSLGLFIFLVSLGASSFLSYERFSMKGLQFTWYMYGQYVFTFLIEKANDGLLNLFLGSFNYHQLTLTFSQSGLLENNSTIFDFAYLAMILEIGLLGFLVYLWTYWYFVNKAFPKGEFLSKFSFFLLLLSSLHYGVSFWMCSQIISSLILSVHFLSTQSAFVRLTQKNSNENINRRKCCSITLQFPLKFYKRFIEPGS